MINISKIQIIQKHIYQISSVLGIKNNKLSHVCIFLSWFIASALVQDLKYRNVFRPYDKLILILQKH